MKKLTALLLALLMVLALTACGNHSTAVYNGYLMENAWTGDFSDSHLKSAIKDYVKNCEPLEITSESEAADVTLEVGSIDSFELVHVAEKVNEMSASEETGNYLDLYVPGEYDASSGILHLDLTSCVGSGTTWSFLILISSGGTDSYDYFRVTFPAS